MRIGVTPRKCQHFFPQMSYPNLVFGIFGIPKKSVSNSNPTKSLVGTATGIGGARVARARGPSGQQEVPVQPELVVHRANRRCSCSPSSRYIGRRAVNVSSAHQNVAAGAEIKLSVTGSEPAVDAAPTQRPKTPITTHGSNLHTLA